MEDTRYIIIANDSLNRIWAYGSPVNNNPFKSEAAAERRKRQMEKIAGNGRDFMVVPLSVLTHKEARF
jgi:hypothetical protein